MFVKIFIKWGKAYFKQSRLNFMFFNFLTMTFYKW